MATKNLSRTAIEGGRVHHTREEEREFTRSERAQTRKHLHVVKNDLEAAYEKAEPRRKEQFYKEFDDKLGPVYKFLDSRCGRNWDKVRSEIAKKFDGRTTAGRHILYNHIIDNICGARGEHDGQAASKYGQLRYHRYIIDGQNRLQKNPAYRSRHRYRPEANPDWEAVGKWLENRRVERCGEKFVWLVPTAPTRARLVWDSDRSLLVYAAVDRAGKFIYEDVLVPERGWTDSRGRKYVFAHAYYVKRLVTAHVPYRAAGLLNKNDEAYLRRLPASARKAILGD